MSLEQKLNPQEEFERHLQDWKAQTQTLIFREECINHPAYQNIIAMGEQALPYIHDAIKKQSAFTITNTWFPWTTVVQAIAGPTFDLPPNLSKNYTYAETYTRGWLDRFIHDKQLRERPFRVFDHIDEQGNYTRPILTILPTTPPTVIPTTPPTP